MSTHRNTHNLFDARSLSWIFPVLQWGQEKRAGNLKGVKNNIRDIKQIVSGKGIVNSRDLQKQS